ncbi:hypothetical protein AB1K42_03010 [Roseibium algicola]|uniref:hypothetical protein n=1 Tax=Roseibium algicola TaxID=2857014 RepID=UPI0034593E38
MNYGRLITEILFLWMTSALFKYGNQNYEALKADFGLLAPLMCFIAGVLLGCSAIILLIKSFRKT